MTSYAASPFLGLSAFPLTPANERGIVDVDSVGLMVDRLAIAGVGAVGLLGSTGIYAYLDRVQRSRALAAAMEASRGRVPLIVGVGAIRTDIAIDLAVEAERLGADGLLLAPVSYTALISDEVERHYAAVIGSTDLPLCIYNNPGTTGFEFTYELVGRIAGRSGATAIKAPAPADGDFAKDLRSLREVTGADFLVGYSGDWNMVAAVAVGCDAFYSAMAGILPEPAVELMKILRSGNAAARSAHLKIWEPLWDLCRRHGSLRVAYEIAHLLGFRVGSPPLPILPLAAEVRAMVVVAVELVTSAGPSDIFA